MNDQFIEALNNAIDTQVQLRRELTMGNTPAVQELLGITINRGRLVEVLCFELKKKKVGT